MPLGMPLMWRDKTSAERFARIVKEIAPIGCLVPCLVQTNCLLSFARPSKNFKPLVAIEIDLNLPASRVIRVLERIVA